MRASLTKLVYIQHSASIVAKSRVARPLLAPNPPLPYQRLVYVRHMHLRSRYRLLRAEP
jgi:hypothetical protein